jgi:hypothetical protein
MTAKETNKIPEYVKELPGAAGGERHQFPTPGRTSLMIG